MRRISTIDNRLIDTIPAGTQVLFTRIRRHINGIPCQPHEETIHATVLWSQHWNSNGKEMVRVQWSDDRRDQRDVPIDELVVLPASSTHPTVFCDAECKQAWTAQWGEFEIIYHGAIENIEANSTYCLWCDAPTKVR